MKNIISIIVSLFLLVGCSDVLDKYPQDEITEASYWNSSKDLELYLNQFYTDFKVLPANWSLGIYGKDRNSDNLVGSTPNDILNGTRSVPSAGGGWSWGKIRSINYFLANADKVTTGLEADINHLKGEGQFFKAYYYFNMVMTFGDVPWIEKVLNVDSEELYGERNPRNVVVDKIIGCLDEAIALMKDQNKVEVGRIHKGIALLFKSRVCLYEGTWEKYHSGTVFGVNGSDGSRYLTLAVDASEKLVQSGYYQLYDKNKPTEDYWNLFNQLDHKNNKEVLLWQKCDVDLGTGHGALQYLNGDRAGGAGLTKSLVDAYLCTDGKPIALSSSYQGDDKIIDVVKNRDPRLSQTVWVPGQVRYDDVIFETPHIDGSGAVECTTGYQIRKGSTDDPTQQGPEVDQGKTAGIVFRYAEALLNLAEAKAELGTLTQGDLDKTINKLRDRAGLPDLTLNVGFTDPNWKFPSLSPIINEIRRERRVELALEGMRYADIMRWAAADELIEGKRPLGIKLIPGVSFPDPNFGKNEPVNDDKYLDYYKVLNPAGYGFVNTRDYLAPLPIDDLTLNTKLTQNPGWD
ncbi:RagB/SusD family nutrient uptake outer membrane protein [Puteibacter caeruleilacunae]|nr:RagB/SusD family nutrient uptake outer membrane protein [Puteibacter caeruleilacunae]